MSYIYPPQKPLGLNLLVQKAQLVNRRSPREIFSLDDNIPYHASRLLLLIRFAGKPGSDPRIEGRTKFVKLDFFVRYPQFLEKAARILLPEEEYTQIQLALRKSTTIESHMVRYRYGPWDRKYYLVLAYLSGKDLISIEVKSGIDTYKLSSSGFLATEKLCGLPEFDTLVTRCRIAGDLLGDMPGSRLKGFIYRHYPEVVHTPYNQIISQDKVEIDK